MRECVIHDAMGQRIAKTVTNKNVTMGDKFVTTYYVRDPQGNVLAVYEHKHGDSDNGTFTLAEQHLYGAGRLGMRKRDLALNATNASESTPVTHYELTNHLGNVMAVISDKASDTNEPTVVSLSDYYPYGMTEPGRNYDSYRYGFNSQENVPELGEGHTTALYWEYDGRLGRRWNVDIVGKAYESNYSVLGNTPLIAIDVNGADSTIFNENGSILCEISNDGGKTSNYFALKTTLTTDQMYAGIKYKGGDTLKGYTAPISLSQAIMTTMSYNTTKMLVGDNPTSFDKDLLKKYENEILWENCVPIPNQQVGQMSYDFLMGMVAQYPDGNREFSWDIFLLDTDLLPEEVLVSVPRDPYISYYIDKRYVCVGDQADANSATSVSSDAYDNHSHPAEKGWIQPPSRPDITNTEPGKFRYVWALGNKTIYIVGHDGVLAKVPFSIYINK